MCDSCVAQHRRKRGKMEWWKCVHRQIIRRLKKNNEIEDKPPTFTVTVAVHTLPRSSPQVVEELRQKSFKVEEIKVKQTEIAHNLLGWARREHGPVNLQLCDAAQHVCGCWWDSACVTRTNKNNIQKLGRNQCFGFKNDWWGYAKRTKRQIETKYIIMLFYIITKTYRISADNDQNKLFFNCVLRHICKIQYVQHTSLKFLWFYFHLK